MRFILRCLAVLAVAVAFGFVLYVAVQVLPKDASTPRNTSVQPQNGNSVPLTPAPRPPREQDRRGGGSGWRFGLGLARRIVVFSALIYLAVLGKNFIFERKPARKKSPD